MAKRLKVSDKSQFYFAYRIGYNSKTKRTEYGDIHKGYGIFARVTEKFVREQSNGVQSQRDGTMMVEVTDEMKYFDEYTKIWLNKTPSNSNEIADFTIVSIPTSFNGIMTFDVKSNIESTKPIWYEYNGNIYKTTIEYKDNVEEYDDTYFIVQTPKNMYFPIEKTSKVWYNEPSDVEDAQCRLYLVMKEEKPKHIVYYFKDTDYYG